MIDPYLVLPQLKKMYHDYSLELYEGKPSRIVAGLQIGDVITWGSWGHSFLVRTDPNGKEHWGYRGVTLLVIDAYPDCRWLEVCGFYATPPHVHTGSWRWPVGLIDERLERKGVRRIGRLVDML